MNTAKHLIISGKVQGVSYRAWFSDRAQRMNISGWVRNRRDGTVEAIICGAPDDVDALVRAANIGPALADVRNVAVADAAGDGYESFEIRPAE